MDALSEGKTTSCSWRIRSFDLRTFTSFIHSFIHSHSTRRERITQAHESRDPAAHIIRLNKVPASQFLG